MANPSYADLTPFGRCVADAAVDFPKYRALLSVYTNQGVAYDKATQAAKVQLAQPELREQRARTRDFLLVMGDIGDIIATMQSYDSTTSMRLHPLHEPLDDCILKYRLPHQSSEGLRKAAIRPERAAKFR